MLYLLGELLMGVLSNLDSELLLNTVDILLWSACITWEALTVLNLVAIFFFLPLGRLFSFFC